MTLAFDASAFFATIISFGAANSTDSHTHTPVGTPRAALVYIVQAHDTDLISTVKWGGSGGTVMANIASSPFVQTAGSEHGVIHIFFLGSSIPTGAQAVNVTSTGAVDIICGSVTLTAAEDTAVVATATNENSTGTAITVSVPVPAGASTLSWTATTGDEWGIFGCAIAEASDTSGVMSFISGAMWSGISSAANTSPDAGITEILNTALGAPGGEQGAFAYRTAIVTGTEPTDPEVVAAAASGAPVLWPFAMKGWRG